MKYLLILLYSIIWLVLHTIVGVMIVCLSLLWDGKIRKHLLVEEYTTDWLNSTYLRYINQEQHFYGTKTYKTFIHFILGYKHIKHTYEDNQTTLV